MDWMLVRMLRAWRVTIVVFHKGLSPFFIGLFFLLFRALMSLGLALDNLIFPTLRKVDVLAPIVIVGNPRTGTTFLHRFLVDQRLGAGTELWRMIAPSITWQILIKPFLSKLEGISPSRHHGAAAHRTGLQYVETEDCSTFFRFFDGPFVYGFFLSWDEQDWRQMFDLKTRNTSSRDFQWFRSIWSRNLLITRQKRVVAKAFSLSLRLPEFFEEFPDARVIYVVRDPVTFVPSALSLITGVLEDKYGFWCQPENLREVFIGRTYISLLALSQTFCDHWAKGLIPREKVLIVTYDLMMSDFEAVAGEIFSFVGQDVSPQLIEETHLVSEQQQKWHSGHYYRAEDFGLTPEKIRDDYAFLYETFGLTHECSWI